MFFFIIIIIVISFHLLWLFYFIFFERVFFARNIFNKRQSPAILTLFSIFFFATDDSPRIHMQDYTTVLFYFLISLRFFFIVHCKDVGGRFVFNIMLDTNGIQMRRADGTQLFCFIFNFLLHFVFERNEFGL